jgi:hypothetical protein
MKTLAGILASICLLVFYMNPSQVEGREGPRKARVHLSQFEARIHSQNGEDGVLLKIFDVLGIKKGYFVEFGVEDGKECNTRFLREACGWSGLMMDAGHYIPEINLQQEFIRADNINALFAKYGVPSEFDLLSIDIDYNDFYVWLAISSYYRPKVVVIEYNGTHLPHEDKVIVHDPNGMWDKTNYCGASILSLYKLGQIKGYSLVYAESRGVNLFFIRNDILKNLDCKFANTNKVSKIYRAPTFGPGPNGGHVQDPYNRPYVTADSILKVSEK